MHEVWEVLRDKYFSFGRSHSAEQLERVKVRNAFLKLFEEHLKSPDDVLTFEVLPSSLTYAVAILDDDVLAAQYDVVQVSESLFEARFAVVGVL